MNEKRVLIAALVSSIFMIVYSQLVLKDRVSVSSSKNNTKQNGRNVTPTDQAVERSSIRSGSSDLLKSETEAILDSDQLEIIVGRRSGAIRRAVLKGFADGGNGRSLRVGGDLPLVEILEDGANPGWKVVGEQPSELILESEAQGKAKYRLSYAIEASKPVVRMRIVSAGVVSQASSSGISIRHSWMRADRLPARQNPLELVIVSGTEKKTFRRYGSPIRNGKAVPRGTTLLSLAERYFCLVGKPVGLSAQTLLIPGTSETIEAVIEPETIVGDGKELGEDIYVGPRDYFYRRAAGFEDAFQIGMLGQIGLILLIGLGWIARLTGNYGAGIIILSSVITCALAPFTLLSFRSMKKMQDLKPKMDKIMAQHKNDPKRANQEVLALYREHKVSPLSSCLPMFIQLPIFMALFQGISHYIELRGKSFLWIHDLSLPDRAAALPFDIPLLGKDINALPIAMAIVMFLQTKISQRRMGADQNNPTAQMMSGPLMPLLFGMMFYHFPSGLVLYWITNSVISLLWYRLAR